MKKPLILIERSCRGETFHESQVLPVILNEHPGKLRQYREISDAHSQDPVKPCWDASSKSTSYRWSVPRVAQDFQAQQRAEPWDSWGISPHLLDDEGHYSDYCLDTSTGNYQHALVRLVFGVTSWGSFSPTRIQVRRVSVKKRKRNILRNKEQRNK